MYSSSDHRVPMGFSMQSMTRMPGLANRQVNVIGGSQSRLAASTIGTIVLEHDKTLLRQLLLCQQAVNTLWAAWVP
jgi:hypothetical protein